VNANVDGVYGFLNTSPFFSLEDTIIGANLPLIKERVLQA
jgi:hypothetical protein